MRTWDIVHRFATAPLHERSRDALRNARVSDRSVWSDMKWVLDTDTNGTKRWATIRWDIDLLNGENLWNEKYEEVVDWLKRLAWTLMASPGDRVLAAKATTVAGMCSGLQILLPWMIDHSIFWPHQLTNDTLDAYLEDLPELLVRRYPENEGDGEVTHSTAYRALEPIYKLWRQRRILEKVGIQPMPSRPWPEFSGVYAVATTIRKREFGWIQPLPDEVAVPLLNKAAWLLGAPAEDILLLRDAMDSVYHRPPGQHRLGMGTTLASREGRQRRICRRWTFSSLEEQNEPWHLPLSNWGALATQRAMQLVKGLLTASILTLQAFAGLRGSELCGIPAGIDSATGLPSCVDIRISSSGFNEIFILRAELSKTEEVPREREWNIGLRPIGSTELPLTVRALVLIAKILEPYRSLADTDRLLFSISASRGLPKSRKGVGRITTEAIGKMYKDFVAEWIDLSALPDQSSHAVSENDLVAWRESKGRIITTHMLRKTFALYVLSADARLLPAVKRQFQHLSMAMTEAGYWGSNAIQIEAIESVSAQQTALMIFELATGRSRIAGRSAERINANLGELKSLLTNSNYKQGWRKTVQWVGAMDLKSTISEHGACMPLSIGEMECWRKVHRRPLGHRRPNFASREPALCAGCRCFWMDARHIPWWEERYVEHAIALEQAPRGSESSFRRIKERARQAKAFLTHIGHDLTAAESRIQRATSRG